MRFSDTKEIIVTGLKLMMIVMVSVSILGYVNSITEKKIEKARIEKTEKSLRIVMPSAAGFRVIESGIFEAYNEENDNIGTIYLVESKGYNDMIQLLVGIDNMGRITKVKILTHLETPGIGSRIVDDVEFLEQFEGKNTEELVTDTGSFDAISGATTSSNAVNDGVKKAIRMWSEDR